VIVKSLIRLIVLLLSAAAAAVVAPRAAVAQQDSSGARLSSTVRTAVEGYNASTTRRVTGAFSVPASTVVAGDVAVLNGPVTISGRIQGSLIAINADVRLEPSARVDQNITVIGGTLTGHDGAQIGGEIRRQEELLRYRLEGERLIAESELVYDDSWWQRHHIRHEIRRGEAYTEFFYVASRAYNRVEGWSFAVGPRIQRAPSWGKINLDAFAIVRTAAPIVWGDQSLGHEANAEVQFGKPIGVAVGGQLFSVIAPTENWQMGNGEVGLASFLLRRDFRDYYARHGGEMYVRFQGGNDADLTFTLSDEQWRDRRDRDPFTLFRGNELWRANPVMDSGSMHLFTARLRADTRGQEGSRWAGWYVNLEFEQGAGRLTRAGAPIIATLLAPMPESVHYSRAFIDVRRFNRISPTTSVALRVAPHPATAGDALPTERKLSIGGSGTLPGYGFREAMVGSDVLQCSRGFVQAGTPAQCDRIAMAQIELRSDFLAGVLRDDGPDDWWRPGFNHKAQWVVFADAGRGWRTDDVTTSAIGRTDDAGYRNGMPPLNSFKSDVGLGVDFGSFGVYWAKAISDGGEPARFFVRLQRRF
jgi:cytoskeletal protein CcmA (bactofilin family)